MGKEDKLKVQFGRSIDSSPKQYEERLDEGLGNQAVVSQMSKGGVGSEGKPRVPPGLGFGGGDRTLGHIQRTDPSISRKQEFDTDSLMAKKSQYGANSGSCSKPCATKDNSPRLDQGNRNGPNSREKTRIGTRNDTGNASRTTMGAQ